MIEKEELLNRLKECLQEEGVEATEEEMQSVIDNLPTEETGELSEGKLEEVAGGRIIWPRSLPIPMLCPRCWHFYILGKPHTCNPRRWK